MNRNLCLLLSLVIAAGASPVVYIVYQQLTRPLKHLTSGIILTERYIMTTKYPFGDYVSSEVCALPVANFHIVSEKYMEKYCLNIADITYADASNVVLIELEKPITFFFQLDPAQIPLVTHQTVQRPLDLLSNCKMVYNVREERDSWVERQLIERAEIKQEVDAYYLDVELENPRKFCLQDNGMPLVCEAAVVGIFSFSSVHLDHSDHSNSSWCCEGGCLAVGEVRVVKLYNEEVQDLLRTYIMEQWN